MARVSACDCGTLESRTWLKHLSTLFLQLYVCVFVLLCVSPLAGVERPRRSRAVANGSLRATMRHRLACGVVSRVGSPDRSILTLSFDFCESVGALHALCAH